MMKVLVLADIHGNLQALNAVLSDANHYSPSSCILLGDVVDYGMSTNEVIEVISNLSIPVLVNIRGNHEDAIINDNYSRFSSSRGVESACYTKSILTAKSIDYIENQMSPSGECKFELSNWKCLAVHGSIEDMYWKGFDLYQDLNSYLEYDYVFVGHTHIQMYYEHFYRVENADMRNKKRTVFINPGSVGQPRNHNPHAQYAIWDTATGEFDMHKVAYDIHSAQALYSGVIDSFYRDRLEKGI